MPEEKEPTSVPFCHDDPKDPDKAHVRGYQQSWKVRDIRRYAAERDSNSRPASTIGEIEQYDKDDDDNDNDDNNGIMVNEGVDSGSHPWTPKNQHELSN